MFMIQPHRAKVEASQRHTRSSQWATPSLEESGDDDKEENAAQLFHYKCLIASSPRGRRHSTDSTSLASTQ